MTSVLEQLTTLLARFDEGAFVALANRGLVRRARKDLEQHAAEIVEDESGSVTVVFGAHRIRFDARGPAHANCDCAANGICQHILAASMALQRCSAAESPALTGEATGDVVAQLQEALLLMSAAELTRHAGKAGYRWAWQFVQDLDPEQPLRISGEQNIVLGFQRPRMNLRYLGGGVEGLIADIDIAQVEKYRVAAVLAFQQAHGRALTPPAQTGKARSASLDLGMDHQGIEPKEAGLADSRQRFRASVRLLLAESVELGLAHLSRGIHERYATLAVWAQGAEYHRLALLLRRIADHVDLLLERAGGADEHRLLDEMAIAFGLVCALDESAAQNLAPAHLVGRARSRYEETASLELIGLGAYPWRSPSGYVGLTMIFWSAADHAFLSCTDARPEGQRGFNPIARYKASGPWGGLGAPAQTTGHRVVLAGAQSNVTGRLSAAESTTATVLEADQASGVAERLDVWTSWAHLAQSRSSIRRSLLAEPQPMKDWVALRPSRFGEPRFDDARQALLWPLYDEQGTRLFAELVFSEYTKHAIARVEALKSANVEAGTLVISRVRTTNGGLIVEPLSLVHTTNGKTGNAVDALYFDAPEEQGLASKLLERFKRGVSTRDEELAAPIEADSVPTVLRAYRHELQRQSERGVAIEQVGALLADLGQGAARSAEAGFPALEAALRKKKTAGVSLLQLNYLCLQYEQMLTGAVQETA